MLQKIEFLALRRKAIEAQYPDLNDMQKKAVFAVRGPVLALAGAGSGKTTVLINRISQLLRFGDGYESEVCPDKITEEDIALLESAAAGISVDEKEFRRLTAVNPASPFEILAITFTNKAAREIKNRLENTLGSGALDIWASTFHSSCARILRHDIDKLGYSRNFTIYDETDVRHLITEAMRQLNIDDKRCPASSMRGYISKAKDRLIPPEVYAEAFGNDYLQRRAGDVYTLYQSKLKAANALDFDDLLMLTVQLLEKSEDVRIYYQKRFKYLLIDEYQDTNFAQHKLVTLLSRGLGNVFVVGDDDQSIYRFRGASVENILSFDNQFENTRVFRLEQNYRSTQNILDAANNVVANNESRNEKSLWTKNDKGGVIRLNSADNQFREGEYIARIIEQGAREGRPYRDYAVLYRLSELAKPVEEAFRSAGIPYRMVGGQRFSDRAEVRMAMSYLSLIENHADGLRFQRVVNFPSRKIGDKTLFTLSEVAFRGSMSLFDAAQNAISSGAFPEKTAQVLENFTNMILDLAALSHERKLPELFGEMLERTGLYEEYKQDAESERRMAGLFELKSQIEEFASQNLDAGLFEFLEHSALVSDIDNADITADAVVMMTIHSAKGLEFETVFLVGMEDGVFPDERNMTDDKLLEEERRLAYVAITRAKRELYISHAHERMMYGRTRYNQLSQFVREIPERCIDRKPHVPRREERTGSRAERVLPSAAAQMRAKAPAPKLAPNAAQRLKLTPGETVEHKAFGRGLVVAVKEMGGDALWEIAFESSGTKRLMAKAASSVVRKA